MPYKKDPNSLRQISLRSGLSADTLRRRLAAGMSMQEACRRVHFGRPIVDWSWTEKDEEWVRLHGPASRREVAERLGVSSETVRLIEASAIESLRRSGGLDAEWLLLLHQAPDPTQHAESD